MTNLTIHFDGGTPCNIPSRGYGIGYGSYNFNGAEPIRVDHGIPCSNNAAETLTLCRALEDALTKFCPKTTKIHILGDSKIVICRIIRIRTGKEKIHSGSGEYQAAVDRLRSALKEWAFVTAEWLPRSYAVAAFGH